MIRQTKHSGAQLAGLLLWRFGLLLAGGTGLYKSAQFLLAFIELPVQIEIGIGLAFSGAVVFMLSLILERFLDMQTEGNLKQ